VWVECRLTVLCRVYFEVSRFIILTLIFIIIITILLLLLVIIVIIIIEDIYIIIIIIIIIMCCCYYRILMNLMIVVPAKETDVRAHEQQSLQAELEASVSSVLLDPLLYLVLFRDNCL
jgi:hypothetical protein